MPVFHNVCHPYFWDVSAEDDCQWWIGRDFCQHCGPFYVLESYWLVDSLRQLTICDWLILRLWYSTPLTPVGCGGWTLKEICTAEGSLNANLTALSRLIFHLITQFNFLLMKERYRKLYVSNVLWYLQLSNMCCQFGRHPLKDLFWVGKIVVTVWPVLLKSWTTEYYKVHERRIFYR